MRSTFVVLCASVLVISVELLPAQEGKATPEERARALLEALKKGDYATASKDFDDKVKKALPKESFEGLWKKLEGGLGPLGKVTKSRTVKVAGNDTVFLTCAFAKVTLDMVVSFDKGGRIIGFVFTPSEGAYEFRPPPYAKKDTFREVALVVGKGTDWELPATLSLPRGDGPFPAVVLVHGSGPHDRDETIGPNKPFRDLAWGLASQGIAVLRYIKRTKQYGAALGKVELTLEEVVVDDAVAAVALLAEQKGIDPKKVFVAGHSQGGFVAPRIGTRAKGVAGLVLLAGNSRPLEDLVAEQFPYLYSLKKKLSDEDKAFLDKLEKQVARVREGKFDAKTPAKDLPLGLSASYWLALKAYDPVATAKKYGKPMLVLQGERDYQVTMADFAGWKKALGERRDVTLKSYPALNHLFMEGKGKSVPAEYDRTGHVAKEVIDDIAAWVKKH